METTDKSKTTEKDFDTVKTFRVLKEKMSRDMWGMSYEQIKEYLRDKKTTPAVMK
jgi:hypothetical protein